MSLCVIGCDHSPCEGGRRCIPGQCGREGTASRYKSEGEKQDRMPPCILTYVGKVEDMQALDVSSLGNWGQSPFLFLSTA